jgi:hypothetical protein
VPARGPNRTTADELGLTIPAQLYNLRRRHDRITSRFVALHMSANGRLCCKSLRADAVELEFKIIESATRALLNQCFLIALDFESMFRAEMVKILLQQYRH